MANALDSALQRALSIRLNLQISLSQLAIVEEQMDIHLDRWLEHNPMPPDMPVDNPEIAFLAMLGTDLKRMWWGSWGDPRGFVPKMAEYFKLCDIAKSDERVLDQIGQVLEPAKVGSWIGVWGGKVVTGWHFSDPQAWDRVEPLFGDHDAKAQLAAWIARSGTDRIERFTQSIGDAPYSEVELAIPGATTAVQLAAMSDAFVHFTGGALAPALLERLRAAELTQLALAVRIRGGQIVRVGGLASGVVLDDVAALAADAQVAVEPKLGKLVSALGNGVTRVEYGRAGTRAGVDVYLEPTEPASPADRRAAQAPTAN